MKEVNDNSRVQWMGAGLLALGAVGSLFFVVMPFPEIAICVVTGIVAAFIALSVGGIAAFAGLMTALLGVPMAIESLWPARATWWQPTLFIAASIASAFCLGALRRRQPSRS